MKTNYWTLISGVIILMFITLLGCTNELAATSLPATPLAGSASTEAVSPTSSLSSNPALPVLAGTSVPIPKEAITPDNVDKIRELAIWGQGRISQVAFSPDGHLLAVGTATGIWLYEADTLNLVRFIETEYGVKGFIFAPDSQRLTAVLGTTTLTTWSISSGEQVESQTISPGYDGNPNYEPKVAFSVNGAILAFMKDERHPSLWDITRRQPLPTANGIRAFGIRDLTLSPDGRLLAIASPEEELVELWDIQSGVLLQTWSTLDWPVVFSPKGDLLVVGLDLWDLEAGVSRCVLDENPTSLAFSADGRWLTSGQAIWEVEGCRRHQTLSGHIDIVLSVAFAPDGGRLASGSWDGTVRLWDTQTGAAVQVLEGYWPGISALAVSPNETIFTAPSFDPLPAIIHPQVREIQVWEIKTGQVIQTLSGVHKNGDINLALSADGKTLVSSTNTGTFIQVWEAETGQPLHQIPDLGFYAEIIALSPDGQKVLNGSTIVDLYDVQTGEKVKEIRHFLEGGPVAFSPDGTKLAMSGGILDMEAGKELYPFDRAGGFHGGPAFSPDGQQVAFGNSDSELWMWQVETGTAVHKLAQYEWPYLLSGLAFSPDGALLASGIWFYRQKQELLPTIRLWDSQSGTQLRVLPGYTAGVEQLIFSTDGKLLISGGNDGTIRLWGIPPE